MTDDDWGAVCFFIDQGWGDFDQDRRDGYAFFLKGFEKDEALGALKLIAEQGKPFLPRPPEIVAAIRSTQVRPVPSWSEAWAALRRAMAARDEQRGYELLNAAHPVLGRFMEMEGGWQEMRLQPFFDPDYGAVRVRDLKARWEEFVDVARERLRQGLALGATAARRGVGPARLDAAMLVEPLRPAPQIGPSAS
jgi:hypothetical protein